MDFHTHTPKPHSIINTSPIDFYPEDGFLYSMGIHPWESVNYQDTLYALKQKATHPSVVMIGETGIDRLRGASLTEQTTLFVEHVKLSEELHKPIVIHCVRAYQEIISLKQQLRPTMAWTIHGFRGNENIATQLIKQGFYISVGDKFNPKALIAIPDNRLLIETDESPLSISTIYNNIATIRGTTNKELTTQISQNIKSILPSLAI